MTGAVECVLVEKAAVQRLREEAIADRESRNPVQIMRGIRTTNVLRQLGLW